MWNEKNIFIELIIVLRSYEAKMFCLCQEIVVGSNMDKIYIVMDYVEHDLKVLMEHMTQGFRIGECRSRQLSKHL